MTTRRLFAVGLLAAVLVAIFVSQFASGQPDGLEFVAEQEGFAEAAEDHDLAETPLADYGGNLTGNETLDTAIAGLVGVLLTLGVGYGVFWLVRRRDPGSTSTGSV
jgi:ABC-type Fe3+ transport system permease subunit